MTSLLRLPPTPAGILPVCLMLLLITCSLASVRRALHSTQTDNGQRRLTLLYALFPVYQLILLLLFMSCYPDWNKERYLVEYLLTGANLLIDLGMMLSIRRMFERIRREEEYSELSQKRQKELDYYQSVQAQLHSLRMQKHDYINFARTLHAMLPPEELTDQAEAVFSHMLQELNDHTHSIYCENEVVNAVLSVKAAAARKQETPLELAVSIPESITVTSADLCSLISNLLDNALEASTRLPAEKRFISLRAQARQDFLIIKAENQYAATPKKENGRLRTTKPDKQEEHGFGLLLVENIAKKYRGSMTVTSEKHCFQVTVVLDLSVS